MHVDTIDTYIGQAVDFVIKMLPELLMALGILIIGLWVIKKLTRILSATLSTSGFSIEIVSFLSALASIALKVLLIVSVAGMVGINTAAFVGVLAAAGLAIGLALQGSLGNFAAGIIIVTFKPYKVGDWIEVKEKFGKVQDIQIFNTIVVTPGNKTLIIPNGEVINGVITNFSKRGNIRLEMKVNLPYSEDFPAFKSLIMEALLSMDLILKNPIPEIGIESFGDRHLVISIRPYVLPDNYWEVYYMVMARIKKVYHDNNISVAFGLKVMGKSGEIEYVQDLIK
ncbi:MAG: mechanosensitive ion channel [Saprospiraceae bacterium]|nr:mechanosensitive ion channel [Saprospiraceae bacterium]